MNGDKKKKLNNVQKKTKQYAGNLKGRVHRPGGFKNVHRPDISPELRRKRGIYGEIDWTAVALLILILAISTFVMSTASKNAMTDDPTYYLIRHLVMMAIGSGACIFVALLDYRLYRDYADKAYIAVCVVLLITLLFGTGNGANRWILGVQPSEPAKLCMIVLFAAFLDANRRRLNEGKTVLRSMLYMAIPAGLIFLEPDLGTSMVFFVVMMVMLYVAGANRRVFGLVLGFVIGFVILVFGSLYFYTDGFTVKLDDNIPWLPLKAYQLMRLAIFINPEMDPLDSGYHIIQSKIAVGSGGLLGKGYGQGTQVQGNFLPEHHTDFIFSVIGEEFGFVIAAGILVLLMLFILRLARSAFTAGSFYGTLIISGVCTMLIFQIFENVGMATGIMPITGLPLPFFSYGGTGMITYMAAVGLVFSVSLRSKKQKDRKKES